jgi:hypothetical protein
LTVTAGRNDEDRITIIISQQYGLGQFALDSALIGGDYWSIVEKNLGTKAEPEDEND